MAMPSKKRLRLAPPPPKAPPREDQLYDLGSLRCVEIGEPLLFYLGSGDIHLGSGGHTLQAPPREDQLYDLGSLRCVEIGEPYIITFGLWGIHLSFGFWGINLFIRFLGVTWANRSSRSLARVLRWSPHFPRVRHKLRPTTRGTRRWTRPNDVTKDANAPRRHSQDDARVQRREHSFFPTPPSNLPPPRRSDHVNEVAPRNQFHIANGCTRQDLEMAQVALEILLDGRQRTLASNDTRNRARRHDLPGPFNDDVWLPIPNAVALLVLSVQRRERQLLSQNATAPTRLEGTRREKAGLRRGGRALCGQGRCRARWLRTGRSFIRGRFGRGLSNAVLVFSNAGPLSLHVQTEPRPTTRAFGFPTSASSPSTTTIPNRVHHKPSTPSTSSPPVSSASNGTVRTGTSRCSSLANLLDMPDTNDEAEPLADMAEMDNDEEGDETLEGEPLDERRPSAGAVDSIEAQQPHDAHSELHHHQRRRVQHPDPRHEDKDEAPASQPKGNRATRHTFVEAGRDEGEGIGQGDPRRVPEVWRWSCWNSGRRCTTFLRPSLASMPSIASNIPNDAGHLVITTGRATRTGSRVVPRGVRGWPGCGCGLLRRDPGSTRGDHYGHLLHRAQRRQEVRFFLPPYIPRVQRRRTFWSSPQHLSVTSNDASYFASVERRQTLYFYPHLHLLHHQPPQSPTQSNPLAFNDASAGFRNCVNTPYISGGRRNEGEGIGIGDRGDGLHTLRELGGCADCAEAVQWGEHPHGRALREEGDYAWVAKIDGEEGEWRDESGITTRGGRATPIVGVYLAGFGRNENDHAMTTLAHASHSIRRKSYIPHYTGNKVAKFQISTRSGRDNPRTHRCTKVPSKPWCFPNWLSCLPTGPQLTQKAELERWGALGCVFREAMKELELLRHGRRGDWCEEVVEEAAVVDRRRDLLTKSSRSIRGMVSCVGTKLRMSSSSPSGCMCGDRQQGSSLVGACARRLRDSKLCCVRISNKIVLSIASPGPIEIEWEVVLAHFPIATRLSLLPTCKMDLSSTVTGISDMSPALVSSGRAYPPIIPYYDVTDERYDITEDPNWIEDSQGRLYHNSETQRVFDQYIASRDSELRVAESQSSTELIDGLGPAQDSLLLPTETALVKPHAEVAKQVNFLCSGAPGEAITDDDDNSGDYIKATIASIRARKVRNRRKYTAQKIQKKTASRIHRALWTQFEHAQDVIVEAWWAGEKAAAVKKRKDALEAARHRITLLDRLDPNLGRDYADRHHRPRNAEHNSYDQRHLPRDRDRDRNLGHDTEPQGTGSYNQHRRSRDVEPQGSIYDSHYQPRDHNPVRDAEHYTLLASGNRAYIGLNDRVMDLQVDCKAKDMHIETLKDTIAKLEARLESTAASSSSSSTNFALHVGDLPPECRLDRNDYKKVRYWTEGEWNAIKNKEPSLGFLTKKNGEPFENSEIAQFTDTAYGLFNSIYKAGRAPQSWKRHRDDEMDKYFNINMMKAHEPFRTADGPWKALAFAVVKYPDHKKHKQPGLALAMASAKKRTAVDAKLSESDDASGDEEERKKREAKQKRLARKKHRHEEQKGSLETGSGSAMVIDLEAPEGVASGSSCSSSRSLASAVTSPISPTDPSSSTMFAPASSPTAAPLSSPTSAPSSSMAPTPTPSSSSTPAPSGVVIYDSHSVVLINSCSVVLVNFCSVVAYGRLTASSLPAPLSPTSNQDVAMAPPAPESQPVMPQIAAPVNSLSLAPSPTLLTSLISQAALVLPLLSSMPSSLAGPSADSLSGPNDGPISDAHGSTASPPSSSPTTSSAEARPAAAAQTTSIPPPPEDEEPGSSLDKALKQWDLVAKGIASRRSDDANLRRQSQAPGSDNADDGAPKDNEVGKGDAPPSVRIKIKPRLAISIPRSSVAAAAAADFALRNGAQPTPPGPTPPLPVPSTTPVSPTVTPGTLTTQDGPIVDPASPESSPVAQGPASGTPASPESKKRKRGGWVAKPWEYQAEIAKAKNMTARLYFAQDYMSRKPDTTKKEFDEAWKGLSEAQRLNSKKRARSRRKRPRYPFLQPAQRLRAPTPLLPIPPLRLLPTTRGLQCPARPPPLHSACPPPPLRLLPAAHQPFQTASDSLPSVQRTSAQGR
ncbi:hypothetical protein DFP72DRAFT_1150265 [Ephemerocybe angulata]|uniref:Uncharacterized protein n=1 Tax=Ephemerocybe angulata TaxID=980116 RepID=A0A8H6LZP8_9AGAR|nr:hypothetical protein DFP72DRAFT_1150265 [Tulosesus angulatus]